MSKSLNPSSPASSFAQELDERFLDVVLSSGQDNGPKFNRKERQRGLIHWALATNTELLDYARYIRAGHDALRTADRGESLKVLFAELKANRSRCRKELMAMW